MTARTKPKIRMELERIESLAHLGLSRREIAASLGVSESTLYARQRESEEITARIEAGRARGIETVAGELMNHIKGGSLRAVEFYLRTRGGWRDEPAEPDAAGTGDIRLTIRRVGPMPIDR